jgi:hypothetical protein
LPSKGQENTKYFLSSTLHWKNKFLFPEQFRLRAEAQVYLNQALQMSRKPTGTANPFLFETLFSLGMNLQSEGRFAFT